MVICTLCVMISNIFILRMWAGKKSMLFLVMPLARTCLVLVLVVLLVFLTLRYSDSNKNMKNQ